MTDNYRVRLSPSGPAIGSPGLLFGTGTAGRAWRRHGAGTAITVPTVTTTAILGTSIPVSMLPGFRYSVEVSYVLETLGVTVSANVTASYRLFAADTSTWGAWVPMSAEPHVLRDTTTNPSQQLFEGDCVFDLSTTVKCSFIEVGVVGDTTAGLSVLPNLSWAKITEYLP